MARVVVCEVHQRAYVKMDHDGTYADVIIYLLDWCGQGPRRPDPGSIVEDASQGTELLNLTESLSQSVKVIQVGWVGFDFDVATSLLLHLIHFIVQTVGVAGEQGYFVEVLFWGEAAEL